MNSCVRKSAIDAQRYFKGSHLQLVVDLSLSGARTVNYEPSSSYGGLSVVESAVGEMMKEGVRVVECVRWT